MNNNNPIAVPALCSTRSSLSRRSNHCSYRFALLPLALASALHSAGALADDAAMLKRMEMLEAELAALKNELKQKETTQQQKGVEVKPGTRVQFGGFIKADAMFSQYSDGARALSSIGDDFLVPSTVPVGDGSGKGDTVFDAHAKHSRLWLKANTDTSAGNVSAYVEMDFNSSADERLTNQATSGLRHAFLSWDYSAQGSLLAGQTWSTFFNVAALPESIDFVGPTSGTLFVRQEQLRWTRKLNSDSSLMLSAENPSAGLYDGGAGFNNNNYDNNSMPDLVARYNGKWGDLSYSVAGLLREVAYEDNGQGGKVDDSKMASAISISGVYPLANGDDIKFMVNHGVLGRYISLNAFRDGAVETDGSIDLLDVTGGYIAYRHLWNNQWRSTLSYALASADNPESVGNAVNQRVANANINLIYSPTPKLSFGAEYLVAERELESGVDGDLKRLQFMGRWDF